MRTSFMICPPPIFETPHLTTRDRIAAVLVVAFFVFGPPLEEFYDQRQRRDAVAASRERVIELLSQPRSADGDVEDYEDSVERCMTLATFQLTEPPADSTTVCRNLMNQGLGSIANCVEQAQGEPQQCHWTEGPPAAIIAPEAAVQLCDNPGGARDVGLICHSGDAAAIIIME